MKIKNTITILCAVILSLTSCAVFDESEKESSSKVHYKWYHKPFFSADDVNFPSEFDFQISYGTYMASDFSTFENDSKIGIIDIDGNIIVENKYDYLGSDTNGHIYLNIEDDYTNDTFCTKYGIFSPDGNNSCDKCGILSTTTWAQYHFYDTDKKLLAVMGNVYDGQASWMGQNWQGIIETDETVTAQQAVFPDDLENYGYAEIFKKYGMVKGNEVIMPFEYENATIFSDGLAAMCKDGKWGYFDENGNNIIPCKYDGDFIKQYPYSFGESFSVDEIRMAYLPSEGYIALNKDNKAGYCDTKGKEVIRVGTFEEARPFHNGKAWVKKNGKWGVIELF